MTKLNSFVVRASVASLVALVLASPAAAHTESDVVAVPAGAEATVTLKPTHGCDESPTVEVAIRVPVAGATAGEVDGWTATATPDGEGNTVVEWTGGSLPADEHGAFPVSFDVAADLVGELLTFPSVQVCENGEELAWIDGDPNGEYPAPRLLILPAGSEPAASIDEVPADAPGRAQLAEVVEVEAEATTTTEGPTTTVAPSTTTSSSEEATTTTEATGGTVPAGSSDDSGDDSDDGLSAVATGAILAGAVVVVLGGGLLLRRRMVDS